jgi:hypothetical protein
MRPPRLPLQRDLVAKQQPVNHAWVGDEAEARTDGGFRFDGFGRKLICCQRASSDGRAECRSLAGSKRRPAAAAGLTSASRVASCRATGRARSSWAFGGDRGSSEAPHDRDHRRRALAGALLQRSGEPRHLIPAGESCASSMVSTTPLLHTSSFPPAGASRSVALRSVLNATSLGAPAAVSAWRECRPAGCGSS